MSEPNLFDPSSASDARQEEPSAPEPSAVDWPELNEAQAQAVAASLDPQLVVAGPGTGKTRVLVCRAAYLLTEHPDRFRPSDVAVITFTRKAARQLTSRLASLVGAQAQHVRAGTIHQFCRRIVDAHTDRADVPERFVVASQAVTDAFWQRWFEEHRAWCKRNDLHSYRQVQTRISRVKLGIDPIFGKLNDGLTAYQAMLRRRGALDFDDLLTAARDLLKDHERVRSAVRDSTRAVLVDEFQDTDPVQFNLLTRIGQTGHPCDGAHLFAVADDDQSIYRFRGAEPKNLQKYIDRYNCAREKGSLHVLQKNYRSNRAIYRVAETVLEGEQRLKRRGEIVTVDESQSPVVLAACASEGAERSFVLDQVQRWIDDGVARREIAVLAPWNATVQEVERQFLRAGIACEASTTDSLMQVPSVRQLISALTLVQCMLENRSFDGPLEDVLEAVLPSDVFARVTSFWHRQQAAQSASLWGTFQQLARHRSAAQQAGLGSEWHHLGRLYAALGNVLQHARTEDATIGGLARETLQQLGASTQLLGEAAGVLPDPAEGADVVEAARRLDAWRTAQAEDPASAGRLLVYDRSTRRVALWRQLVRRALDIEAGPPIPEDRSSAAFATPPPDDPAPLSGRDLIVTADPAGCARWADRSMGVDPDDPPLVLALASPSVSGDLFGPVGLSADRVLDVAPASSRRPTLRLFRLLQAAVSPRAPEPLFDSYVMVDLETTSLDTEQCRVAEIGALRVDGGEVVDTFETLVELPGDLTRDEADTLREVCGLDPDTDFHDALPEKEAWRRLCEFVGARPMVAHNGRQFDFRILRRLAHTYRDSVDARWTTTYDTLPAAIELVPDLPRHTAEALRQELLDEETPTQHRALADCRDQQRILEALQARRARRQRTCALEPLLPIALAALYDEAQEAERDLPMTEHDEILLEIGYRWALRDASSARTVLRRLLSRALPDLIRSTPALYDAIDEEQLVREGATQQPGLSGRIEALLAPYRDRAVHEGGLADVLSHLALWGGEEPDRGVRVVTISSYHSAKGLEFERVVCSGVHGRAFPPFYASDDEDRRESRRLLYVGMTRAEQHLVLTYPKRNSYGSLPRSPFLNDAPPEWVEKREA